MEEEKQNIQEPIIRGKGLRRSPDVYNRQQIKPDSVNADNSRELVMDISVRRDNSAGDLNRVELKIRHTNPEITKDINDFLKTEEDKGNLIFTQSTRRICDFCNRRLFEGDDFETLKSGLDKCRYCKDKNETSNIN